MIPPNFVHSVKSLEINVIVLETQCKEYCVGKRTQIVKHRTLNKNLVKTLVASNETCLQNNLDLQITDPFKSLQYSGL